MSCLRDQNDINYLKNGTQHMFFLGRYCLNVFQTPNLSINNKHSISFRINIRNRIRENKRKTYSTANNAFHMIYHRQVMAKF